MGLISNNNESPYLHEVESLVMWCLANKLSLKVNKTKELCVEFVKMQTRDYSLLISEALVERVSSVKYLGVQLTEDLSWTNHTDYLTVNAWQQLYFLCCLTTSKLSPQVLRKFYAGTIKSFQAGNITTWCDNATEQGRKALMNMLLRGYTFISPPTSCSFVYIEPTNTLHFC